MSRFRLHLRGSPFGSIIYDTRWGTSTDASGWITFGLKPGCRRIWLDSANGNDANDGLTAATAKATWNAAHALWSNSGNGGGSTLPGDQLMIAGGQGQTYTDSNNSYNISNFPGFSATYPNAILNYNSTAPSDASQYGRLVGPNMPVVTVSGVSMNMTAFTNGYITVQGVEFKAPNGGPLAYQASGYTYQTGNKPGIVFQNTRWNGVQPGWNPAGTGVADAPTNIQGVHISKSSMWNSQGVFIENADRAYIQDFIIAHCGWNIGAHRDDTVANGGAQVFTHNFYLHASCTNLRLDRVVSIDSAAEAFGIRGDLLGAQMLVSIDCAFGLNAGGFSTSYTEAPAGVNYRVDDAVIMGSDKIDSTHPGGVSLQWNNTLAGSYIRNCAAFDYENFDANDTVYNRYAVPGRNDVAQPVQYILLDKWSGWRWGPTEISSTYPSVPLASGSGDLVNCHQSWSNSILDVNPTGLNGSVTNCSQRVSAPTGYKTRIQTYAALGFSSKAAMVNAMLWRPDLPWAQAINSISLPAMGLTPQFQTIAPPSMAGITPATIYPTALATLTLPSLNFTRGTPKAILVGNTSAGGFTLTSSDLPAGFTLVGRLLSYDGSGSGAASPTIHIVETSVQDTLGTNTTPFTLSIS